MNRSSATRSRVSCLLAAFQNPTSQSVRVRSSSAESFKKTSARNPLLKSARFPGREDDGKLLNKAFPLADHGCAILGEFRRNLFALPRRDVALLARAKNAVDESRASDQANLARMQRGASGRPPITVGLRGRVFAWFAGRPASSQRDPPIHRVGRPLTSALPAHWSVRRMGRRMSLPAPASSRDPRPSVVKRYRHSLISRSRSCSRSRRVRRTPAMRTWR